MPTRAFVVVLIPPDARHAAVIVGIWAAALIEVHEIARAAPWLWSDESSFTSGINMMVDGSISRRVNF